LYTIPQVFHVQKNPGVFYVFFQVFQVCGHPAKWHLNWLTTVSYTDRPHYICTTATSGPLLLSILLMSQENKYWEKKCTEYEVKGPRPRGRPKRTWREVVEKDVKHVN